LIASAALPAINSASAADDTKITDTVKKWQQNLTQKFSDTFGTKPLGTASLDLREQKDSYTLRLHLPDRDIDKVEVALHGDTLHITAPAGENSARYEQSIALANAAPNAVPAIERKPKDHLLVVTVAKGSDRWSSAPDLSLTPWTSWERDIFARMEQMRREMDRAFEDSFAGVPYAYPSDRVFDVRRFGSTLDLKTEGDNYVVRAYLPERDMKNVNVTVEDQTLKIEARSEDITRKEGEGTTMSHQAQFSQLLALPGPVEANKMQVDKKEGMLVVTLPKAKGST
jgi:HSP20 family molecular chaperone IbpA